MKFEDFGINVAKERIKQNMSANELSGRIGKDSSYISKLENGKINPSLKMIIAISECLNVPLEKFFK